MQGDLFNQQKITQQQIKILIGSFLSMFIMVGLQYFGIHSPITFSNFPKIISPVSNNNGLLNILRPKIEMIQNSFYLKKPFYLIQPTYASANTVYADNQETLGQTNYTQSMQLGNFEIERR